MLTKKIGENLFVQASVETLHSARPGRQDETQLNVSIRDTSNGGQKFYSFKDEQSKAQIISALILSFKEEEKA